MSFWIAVHLPLLPLEALHPSWPDSADRALRVVIEGDRVRTVAPAALACGVQPGLRRGSVAALAPEAELLARDPLCEAAALNAIALALLQFTPQVSAAEEDSLLLDVSACLRLFGGPRALTWRVAERVRALGFSLRLGAAPTARGAWLLARPAEHPRRPPRRALKLVTLGRRLDRLPCALLPQARFHADWLRGIGCRTLGELRRLPRAGLRRRTDASLPQALDAAYGLVDESHVWIEAPPHFTAGLELPERIDRAEMLLYGARRLVLQLSGWLAARRLAVGGVVLHLVHERGRTVLAPTPVDIRLATPDWHEDHLLHLLRERLARLCLPAPVIALQLEAARPEPMPSSSGVLFPEPGGSPGDFQRLIEVLAARLGSARVQMPAPRADHRPEVRNTWHPALAVLNSKAGQGEEGVSFLPPRPFWLLHQPMALRVQDHRPVVGAPLRLVAGPERIECGWWDGAPVQRDYFVARSEEAVCYWVFRERGGLDPRWYLHGLFG